MYKIIWIMYSEFSYLYYVKSISCKMMLPEDKLAKNLFKAINDELVKCCNQW